MKQPVITVRNPCLSSSCVIPGHSIISILFDSCAFMRGVKIDLKIKSCQKKAPHLLNIDCHFCHPMNNIVKQFCLPFGNTLKSLFMISLLTSNGAVSIKLNGRKFAIFFNYLKLSLKYTLKPDGCCFMTELWKHKSYWMLSRSFITQF